LLLEKELAHVFDLLTGETHHRSGAFLRLYLVLFLEPLLLSGVVVLFVALGPKGEKHLHSELGDLLGGDLLEELIEVLVGHVVVDFALLGLNDVGLLGGGYVLDCVGVLGLFRGTPDVLDRRLVVVGCVLHIYKLKLVTHETFGGRVSLLHPLALVLLLVWWFLVLVYKGVDSGVLLPLVDSNLVDQLVLLLSLLSEGGESLLHFSFHWFTSVKHYTLRSSQASVGGGKVLCKLLSSLMTSYVGLNFHDFFFFIFNLISGLVASHISLNLHNLFFILLKFCKQVLIFLNLLSGLMTSYVCLNLHDFLFFIFNHFSSLVASYMCLYLHDFFFFSFNLLSCLLASNLGLYFYNFVFLILELI